MAMGGSYYKGNGGGNRGRPYGVVLILAFGAALMGVMVVHKLRERRIFNLLVKEKDRDLISLQFLLQKEIDLGKEMKRKNEEMKVKILALRDHKTELDNKLSEMHSTVASLKDEQRLVASALEEKQNEIKLLKEKEGYSEKEDARVEALTESLKQKEAEIEDLRRRLEVPVKVWSVSTDDPSNPNVNVTMSKTSDNEEKSEKLHENEGNEESRTEEGNVDTPNSTARISENATRVEDRESIIANVTDQAGSEVGGNVVKTIDGEENGLAREMQERKEGDPREGVAREASKETQDESRIDSGYRVKGRRGRGRRWKRRRAEKNGESESDVSERRLRSRRVYKEEARSESSVVLKMRNESSSDDNKLETSARTGGEGGGEKVETNAIEIKEATHSSEVENPNSEEDQEIADKKEAKTDGDNEEFFKEPSFLSEENEEYKEETDESEF